MPQGGPKTQHRVCDRLSEGEERGADPSGVDVGTSGEGMHFWSRGYCVGRVGVDEGTVREYIRQQEEEEKL